VALVDALTVIIATAALVISGLGYRISKQADRRIEKADERVQWRLLPPLEGHSFYVQNDGPADAYDVAIEFAEHSQWLSTDTRAHPVVHAGSKIWIAKFAPPSDYVVRDSFRLTWKGCPEGGWSTQI
jgi:hypothetical protein